MSITDAAFETIVQQTIAGLPPKIRTHLDDVAIVVEARAQGRGARSLLGLYEGVPLTQWGRDYSGKSTDKITLYKDTIEDHARSTDELPHVIRETLLHEIAHYLGFEHDKIHAMERRWRARRKGNKNM